MKMLTSSIRSLEVINRKIRKRHILIHQYINIKNEKIEGKL